jgi:hypothetical protein
MHEIFTHSMVVCLISLSRSNERHTIRTLAEVHPVSLNSHSPRPRALYSRMTWYGKFMPSLGTPGCHSRSQREIH